jgi:hypothetical protein
VDGLLTVESGGRFDWTGIVIVRSEERYMPVKLEGRASVTGGLVVVQNAYPPGGHMDVTVWRDLTRGLSPSNVAGSPSVAPWAGRGHPFYQHLHRFDYTLGTRRVSFLDGGRADLAQETWTQFYDTLSQLGDEEVYLAFDNEDQHGYGQYLLSVDGEPDPFVGSVRAGFGGFAAEGATHRTRAFQAQDLNDFVVDVKVLQALKDRFDGEDGCDTVTQWPRCIGRRWDRGDALRIQLRKAATDQIVYETALYWHMQSREFAEYETRLAMWRTEIQNGALFGTRLELGDQTDIQFDLGPIRALTDRLGFDGDQVIHVGSEVRHQSYQEGLAWATRPDGRVEVCHKAGSPAERTRVLEADALGPHLRHGDPLGACDGSPASGAAVPPRGDPASPPSR